MAPIEFEHVWKRYADGFEAVKDMSLEIRDGEFMILVGPSGCGKSTALRMIAGLEDVSDGQLVIGNEIVNDVPAKQRDIAMVFQNYALYPHMTVHDNMGFALRLAKVPKPEIERKVQAAARILDLEQHLDRKPANLSGGQRQRVAMGRAIVRDPKAFLMDEPLSNLDAKLRVHMRTEVARIQRQLGTTTVYVTHDQTEAMTLGDRVAVMRGGIIQQVETPGSLYDEPANLFVAGFIGSPAMNFLPGHLQGDVVRLRIGDARLPARLRKRLETAANGHRGTRDVIVGIRPEQFEDAAVAGDSVGQDHLRFTATVDVVESMGSEKFAHFDVQGHVEASDLKELAKDAGTEDLPSHGDAQPVVARLDASSRAQAGARLELVLDTREIKLFDPKNGHSLAIYKTPVATA
jgi:multiple sugar transport system ATP-binding protein